MPYFTVSASVLGEIYPNASFILRGQTKENGTVELSLCNPGESGDTPAEILHVSGTVVSTEAEPLPAYGKKSLDGVNNIFAFNEQYLAAFMNKMLPIVVRSALSFVEAAPTSACQAFLDDLTDLGILGMALQ